MSIWEIIGEGAAGLAVLLTLIQVTPIKVNPWSAIARVIGRAINRELAAQISDIDRRVLDIDKRLERSEALIVETTVTNKRTRILRFGDELRRGVTHSEEHFAQILTDVTDYERYCGTHPDYPNERAVLTCKIIKDTYARRITKNDFI